MIRPLSGRLIVELEEPPEKVGSLFMPLNARREPWETARVLHVHEDETRLKPGDRVLIPHGTGMYTTDSSKVIGVLREQIAAILEDES